MKTAAVIFVFFFAAWQIDARALSETAPEKLSELDADEEACVTELNLDKEKIVRLNAEDIGPEDDDDFNKFTGCYSEKKGFKKPNGEMDFEKITEELLDIARKDPETTPVAFKLYKQIVTLGVESCQQKPPSGSTYGQTAIKTFNCIVRNIKEITEV